jgi:hypothetical protein
MKLFKIQVQFTYRRAGRTGAEVIVHARSSAAAEKLVQRKFPKCEISKALDLGPTPKHFVIADLLD